jgi:transcription-repair coupling factor (superfamily II helicase)
VKEERIRNNPIGTLSKSYIPLKEDILAYRKISGVDYDYYEIACELLGILLDRVVWLSISKGEEAGSKENNAIKIHKGEEFNLDSLLDLGYERVERVWNEGEVSVLGDVVIIWPFSMNNLVRLSLLGKEVEEISVVGVESRKKIRDVEERTLLSKDSELLVGNEESSKSVNISLVSNLGEEEGRVDLGIRNIPGIETYSTKSALMEISKNYKNRGYEIWYLTNSLEKYDLEVAKEVRDVIDEVFPAKNITERSIKKGFVSTIGKVLVLTDLEVLGELDLSSYQKRNINMDPGSVEILKKIVPGDYVVHEDHGIGKFVKVVKKDKGPYIEVAYKGADKLFIPLTASDKLTKYIGTGRKKPILTGLSSGVWRRISKKAKERQRTLQENYSNCMPFARA